MQLVNLAPEELGDWQKPKAAPKKKKLTGKKTVGDEEKEEDEDEEEEEENEDETAEDGGDEEDSQSKETYIPRPTAHPRGTASANPAPAEPSRKRKASDTPSQNKTVAAERRAKLLKGAGTGAQPSLFQMGFVSKR